jgi:hypothetical protein
MECCEASYNMHTDPTANSYSIIDILQVDKKAFFAFYMTSADHPEQLVPVVILWGYCVLDNGQQRNHSSIPGMCRTFFSSQSVQTGSGTHASLLFNGYCQDGWSYTSTTHMSSWCAQEQPYLYFTFTAGQTTEPG